MLDKLALWAEFQRQIAHPFLSTLSLKWIAIPILRYFCVHFIFHCPSTLVTGVEYTQTRFNST